MKHRLVDQVPPWHSPVMTNPRNQPDDCEAFWDVPIEAEHHAVRANRIDTRIVSHRDKKVTMPEMTCPEKSKKKQKNQEKLMKYDVGN